MHATLTLTQAKLRAVLGRAVMVAEVAASSRAPVMQLLRRSSTSMSDPNSLQHLRTHIGALTLCQRLQHTAAAPLLGEVG